MVGLAVQIPTQEGAHRAAAARRARLRCSAFMLGHVNTPILCHSSLLPTCIFPTQNGAPVWYQASHKVIESAFFACSSYPVVARCRIANDPGKDHGAPTVYHNCASMSRQQAFAPSCAYCLAAQTGAKILSTGQPCLPVIPPSTSKRYGFSGIGRAMLRGP